jgi:hypothetical protein
VIGIIMNGVTGRMGTNQHLIRSIKAIRDQGGSKSGDDLTLMPDPILTGRNHDKLAALAQAHGRQRFTTDVDAALANPRRRDLFRRQRHPAARRLCRESREGQKGHLLRETDRGRNLEALRLAKLCEDAGVKNGVVQDKLWLSGIRKFKLLRDQGFFGRILSVRGEFGYWVFTGEDGRSACAASIMELPQGRRRRHHRRYALPLALRDRQSLWQSEGRLLPRSHAHAQAHRRARQTLRLHQR